MSNYGKLPPQNTEIEKEVLGVILLEKEAYDTASEIIKHHCFYTDAHKSIFKAMSLLVGNNKPIDTMTVAEALIKAGELEKIGGLYYLTQLTERVKSGAALKAHCQIIFEKFLKRELARVSQEINAMAYDEGQDSFELLDSAEKLISEIGANNIESGMTHIGNVLHKTFDLIEKWKDAGSSITGIESGFEGLDKATRGWQPGDFIILGARPSVGKTAFALNLVRNAAKNTTVAVWSLEMKSIYLVLRMLAAESDTFLYRLQTGKLSDEEMFKIRSNAGKTLSNLNIFFDDKSAVTLSSVSRKARRLKKTEGLGLIVIDYLQLMSGEKGGNNREQEISKISRGLKNLAQELDIPIIALSQLSRENGAKAITWESGPPINSLRESGAIEQDADVIMMLWGATDTEISDNKDLEGRRKIRIGKQRNGSLITEELNFKDEIQLFEKIDNLQGNFVPMKNYPVYSANENLF